MDNVKGILELIYIRFLQRDILAITSCGFIIVLFFTGDLNLDNNLYIDNSKLLLYIPISYFIGMVINIFRGFILHILSSKTENKKLFKEHFIFIEKYYNDRINFYKVADKKEYIIDDYERFHFIISLIGNFLISAIMVFIILINKYLFLIVFFIITILMIYIKHNELIILMESSKNNIMNDNEQ
jgi:hypothetical protein